MTLRSAEQHYRTQAALAVLVRRRVLTLWGQVPADDINAWRTLEPAALSVVTSGQYAAARVSEGYVAQALREQGVEVPPEVAVSPAAFAAMPNQGRPVRDLVDQPRITALDRIGAGMTPSAAMGVAGNQLDRIVTSLVQDAGRQADGVAVFARPTVGWVRMVNAPCCKDCAILAGRWYRSNQGFDRHPNCDCRHVPAAEDAPGDVGTDPAALFGSGRVTGLRENEAKAIADGADPAQVVNANRGRSANKMTTTEGATRRSGRTRLTPEGIYARAGDDRGAALSLLRENGYVRP